MPERLKELSDEFWIFIFKTLPYSLSALAMSIAAQVHKNKRFDWLNIFASVITGLSMAWMTGSYINNHFSVDVAPFVIGFVSITAKELAYYLTYVFKFDVFGDLIVDVIKKKFNK